MKDVASVSAQPLAAHAEAMPGGIRIVVRRLTDASGRPLTRLILPTDDLRLLLDQADALSSSQPAVPLPGPAYVPMTKAELLPRVAAAPSVFVRRSPGNGPSATITVPKTDLLLLLASEPPSAMHYVAESLAGLVLCPAVRGEPS